ncbi:MAG TPA: HAMP domain-containing sensor histidine kinase [Vicinamibacterales bacterium]|nr:HAMP domain-containing sensor histidine kinase [Vicinamibacterales bacterium]
MSNRALDPSTSTLVTQYAHLLSLAAHEFRTPASVVGGYLRMLQKDTESPLSERQRKMIDEAARSCARLVALIGELSEVGKLDSNALPVRTDTFDLFADLEEVARNVHEAEDREVRLELSGVAAGAMVAGDRPRLSAAFGAFFRALLREQPTAVTMVCERRLVTDGTSTSAVVVIARESDVQRAYESPAQPFDEHRGGIGLSLPIARRVIERTGGRIWAPTPASDTDRGLRSALVVSIPLPE